MKTSAQQYNVSVSSELLPSVIDPFCHSNVNSEENSTSITLKCHQMLKTKYKRSCEREVLNEVLFMNHKVGKKDKKKTRNVIYFIYDLCTYNPQTNNYFNLTLHVPNLGCSLVDP